MLKVDHTIGDSSPHCGICTNCVATIDRVVSEKDDSSVNNHAVICFVSYN